MKPFQVLMTVSLNSRGHAAHPFISSPGSKHVFFGECTTTGAEKNPRPGSSDFLTVKKERTVL